ncbi:MAG: YeeE/YedE family protein [Lentisphaeria bacterium]|nr:YeeE/YedE family protein [Candidatus Neomarinimicrobiota bacterium]MCF7842945.1 YeeE/YedE family protein [Lentisphaeria bacterium]
MNNKYMNPYLAGFLLGIVLLMAFFFSGRGLGASGAVKSALVYGMDKVAPTHTVENAYFGHYVADDANPLNNWLVYEILGVIVGGFLSGALSRRLKLKIEHFPGISSKRRLVFALIGGVLFGFGSQLGRGCTSGSALTGMAVLSVGGFVTMAAIFGTAFAGAYFFRKNWIG